MVVHDHVVKYLTRHFRNDFLQNSEKMAFLRVSIKDEFVIVATLDDVVDMSWFVRSKIAHG